MSHFRKILAISLTVLLTEWAASAIAQDAMPPMPQTQTNKTQATAPDSAGLFPSADITTESAIEIPDGVETHPPLRLTPDKSEIVRLDRPVVNLIVGNPTHANVLMDNQRMLVVVPKLPGATFFTALDKDGKVVMQRHIIVASPTQKYVRVKQTCAGQTSGACLPTRVYYCPDMCHEVNVMNEGEAKRPSKGMPSTINRGGDSVAMSSEPTEGEADEEAPPTNQEILDVIRQLGDKLGETEE